MTRRRLIAVASVCAATFAGAGAHAERKPGPMQELAPLSGHNGADAFAINDAGTAVGGSYLETDTAFTPRPVVWEAGGAAIDLMVGYGRASDINDAGQICGSASQLPLDDPAVEPVFRAFRYDHGEVTYLEPLDGYPGALSHGINAAAQVAGASIADTNRATVWRDGGPEALPFLADGDHSEGWAINDAGVVTGYSNRVPGGVQIPVMWRPIAGGGHQVVELENSGEPSNDARLGGYGRSINNHGVISGFDRNKPRAWVVATGASTTLSNSTGVGNGINDAGEVVGYVGLNGGNFRAAYWPAGGAQPAIVLGTLGGHWSVGRAINEGGDIVGTSQVGKRYSGFVIWR